MVNYVVLTIHMHQHNPSSIFLINIDPILSLIWSLGWTSTYTNNTFVKLKNLQILLGLLLTIMNISVWPVPVGPSVTTSSTDFFLPKPGFFGIYIEIFSSRNHFKNQYLPHSESKSNQINSIKSLLIKNFFFQTHQRHIPIPPNFQLQFNLI